MNTNLIHNVLNVLIAAAAAGTALLIATGCVELPGGALDCSASWVSPTVTAWGAAGMGVLKSIINIARDGFGGLAKHQPPVQ